MKKPISAFSLPGMRHCVKQLSSAIVLALCVLMASALPSNAGTRTGASFHPPSKDILQTTITGRVTDSATGKSLAGVTIQVKGGTVGTTTNDKGRFSLTVSDNAVLVVSYLGYRTKLITLNGRSVLHIELAASTTGLNQIVVVGYGSLKKSDVTGAVATIGEKEIEARPVSNAIQAMQGQVAGVDVTSNERPGEIGDITIRGVRSLTASNTPLFVVDGVPLTTGGIDFINPDDIATINVLKDASATAIYGSRGANGVVIITTKHGQAGEFKLSYDGSVTMQKLVDNATPMNAAQYIQWRRWAYYYANPSLYPRGDQPTEATDYAIFKGSSDPSAWANIMKGWASGSWDGSKVATTDWTKMVTQTGFTTQHTLSVSGGSDKLTAYASFGYLKNKGTSKGQGYTRYSGNTSLNFTPTPWFTFGANINTSYGKQEYGQSAKGRTAISAPSSIYNSAKAIYPYAVPYDSAGNRIIYPGGDQAVKTVVDEWKYSQDERVTFRTVGSFHAELNFGSISGALKGLKYRMNFGPDFSLYRDGVYIDGLSAIRNGTSYASLEKTQTLSYTLDNLIYYDRVFGDHSINVTLLQTQTAYDQETSSLSANAIPFASQKWNALTSSNVPSLLSWNSGLIQKQLKSYMGRVNYSYKSKYLLTVSGRWDGASQLAPGHKWSFFPSTAIGWRIDQEDFMQNVSWINQLKLRFGVGTTGNSAIDPYATKGGIDPLFYPFGTTITAGSTPDPIMANQNLGWEKTLQYNLGFDYAFFHGRISGSLDVYTTKTKDLLMEESIPTVTGFSTTYANIGQTANKGFDISVNTVNLKTGHFQWTTTLNASYHKDHIVALANGNQNDVNNKWFIGEPIGVIYGYQADGLWHEGDSALMSKFNATGSSFQPGMVHPVDQNGDGKIDANHDRVVIGNTLPRWVLGMVNNFSFDNFEFSFFLYGRLGYMYDTGGEAETGRFNQRLIDYYNENNKDATYQKPIYTAGTGDIYYQSIGYLSGSFLEIRNVSLAYNFPASLISQWGMQRLRLYLQAADLGMIYSRIDWINMDVQSSYWNRGFTAGINVTF
jgi:TonB-linked SusC/RagA family outer membrane protein